MRKSYSFLPEQDFIPKALQFAERESHVVYLNPNSYQYPYSAFKHVLALGVHQFFSPTSENKFEALKVFLTKNKEWAFGFLSYDLKNDIEELDSENEDHVQFPSICFFIPKHLIFIEDNRIEIQSVENPELLYEHIQREQLTGPFEHPPVKIEQKISRDEYIRKIKQLQQHILEGDIYEVNFCMEYFAKNVAIHPVSIYTKLNNFSPMPFSCFLKIEDRYLMCASPERFLKKEGNKIISQPIKGTAKRELDPQKDQESRNSLLYSEKEKAENVMIVDLVRNDLSRHAIPGSVMAEELCAVYTFPSVHQMISTVVGEINSSVHPVDIIKDAFPMGSMTGAPKVKAMKLIEEFEQTKRGIFSGAVGYFSPDGNFDFNVVIRSILYNASDQYLSFQAGSAITFYSDIEKEYEECTVKTAAIRMILQN